jgi:hypothetical protein
MYRKLFAKSFSDKAKGYYDYISDTIKSDLKEVKPVKVIDNTDELLKIIKCPLSEMDLAIHNEENGIKYLKASVFIN